MITGGNHEDGFENGDFGERDVGGDEMDSAGESNKGAWLSPAVLRRFPPIGRGAVVW